MTVLLGSLLLAACTPAERAAHPASGPAHVTLAQFQSLRWLEGRWRGSEGGSHPFFEEYRLLDDSTMRTLSLGDSTGRQVTDSGTLEWRDTMVTSRGGDAAWALTALDSASARFDPLANVRNSFTWTRTSPRTWTATLQWADSLKVVHTKVYQMERLAP